MHFEVWKDEDGVTLTDNEGIKDLKQKQLFSGQPKLLYKISADTPEEAMAVHHIKMGWEPFRPEGPAELCPKDCGSYYYPNGSGICPKCGKIN